MTPTLGELRRAAEALPPGAGLSLSREYLLQVLPADPARVPDVAELSIADVARKFGRSASTVRGWLEDGRLPGAYKLRGRSWRIPPAALDAFLEDQQGGPTSPPQPGPALRLKRGQSLGDWRKSKTA